MSLEVTGLPGLSSSQCWRAPRPVGIGTSVENWSMLKISEDACTFRSTRPFASRSHRGLPERNRLKSLRVG